MIKSRLLFTDNHYAWSTSSIFTVFLTVMTVSLLLITSCKEDVQDSNTESTEGKVVATVHNSNWDAANINHNGMITASNGNVYYVLSSTKEVGGKMYSYNPDSDVITHIADIGDVLGDGSPSIVKTSILEYKSKLYFGTTLSLQNDSVDSPKGHVLSFDIETNEFEDLAIAPGDENILSLNLEENSGTLFGITSPSGYVFRYSINEQELKAFGSYSVDENIENSLCRSLAIDQNEGGVFFTNYYGALFRYDFGIDDIENIMTDSLNKDYFVGADGSTSGYQWSQSLYCLGDEMIYAVMNKSEYLMKLNPEDGTSEVVGRFSSDSAKEQGMFPENSSMGLALAPDSHTIYYFSAMPNKHAEVELNVSGMQKGYYLVSYNVLTDEFSDHGEIITSDGNKPTHLNAMSVGKDGKIYALCTIEKDGVPTTDLISMRCPQVGD